MKKLAVIMVATAVSASAILGALWAAETAPVTPQKAKNWTPPATKIYAQTLVEQIMANHPELVGVTFHGVPPETSKVYTMFAASYVDRIGNPDSPGDIEVITKGITVVNPRWHRDSDEKVVVSLPLRNAGGENIGELVLGYKNPPNSGKAEKDFFLAATALRDSLQIQIPSYASLFDHAK